MEVILKGVKFISTFILLAVFSNSSYGQFVENAGQVIDRNQNFQNQVEYYTGFHNHSAFFEKDRVVFSLNKLEDYDFTDEQLMGSKEIRDSIRSTLQVQNFRFDLEFIGANSNLKITPSKKVSYPLNFFLNKRENIMDVSHYEMITYENIYDNIDLIFYYSEKGLKYDFKVNNGGNIDDISLKYDGADVELLNGEIQINTPIENFTENIPLSYLNEDKTREVEVSYIEKDEGVIGFETAVTNYTNLTIDPFLTWGTYFEGTSASGSVDRTQNVADENGNLYTSGYANNNANDYPVVSAGASSYQQNYLLNNHYIFKFNSDRQLEWATYYGSSESTLEWSLGIQHIAYHNNTLHIVGNQLHETAPLLDGGGFYQETPTGRPFWLRFEANTGALEHATFIGGHSGGDPSIAVSNSGMVAIIQEAYDFSQVPIVNRVGAYNQATNGGYKDMYIMLLNSSYNQIWGTFLGGPNTTENFHVTFDNNDNIFFVGEANNTFSPTASNTHLVNYPGSYYQGDYVNMGSHDLIIGKFNTSGSLIWHTLYGGDGPDGTKSSMGNGSRVIIDPNTNDLVVTAGTRSMDLPVQNMTGAYYQGTPPANTSSSGGSFSDFNSCILKFNNDGVRQWATYWGDDPSGDLIYDGVFTGCSKFLVASRSWDHQTTSLPYGFNQSSGNQSFLMQFDENFAAEWSTYLGLGGIPRIAYSSFDNRLYMANQTWSTDTQPVTDPGGGAYYDPVKSGTGSTYMLWELDLDPQIDGDDELCVGNTLQLDGLGEPSGSSWSSSNTSVATVDNNGLVEGISDGTAIITFETADGCSGELEVTVNPGPTVGAGSDVEDCEGNQVTLTAFNPDGANLSWTGGISDGTAFTPSLGLTTYTVTATLGSCSSTDEVDVTVNETPTFSVSGTNPTACGANDGEILIEGLNNNETYSVNYNNGTPTNETSNASGEIIIDGLSGGLYEDFEVTLNGCTGTVNDDITLTEPNAPSVDAGSNFTVCAGEEVTLTALNPDDADISWNEGVDDGVPFIITETTTFTVTAEEAGCINTDNITIEVAPEVNFSVTSINSTCGQGGQLVITGLEENEDYSFSYNGGASENFTTNSSGEFTISDLTPGTYEDFVLTYEGCDTESTEPVEIEDDIFTPALTVGNATCQNDDTYSVEFSTHANATISTDEGVIQGNEVVDIPLGTTVTITSSFGGNCETSIEVGSPVGCDEDCENPNLSVSQGVCDGDGGYSVSFIETTGANVTATAGTVDGNSVVDIPLGTNLTIIATNGDCLSTIVVESPENCDDPCSNPAIGIGGYECQEDETYDLFFTLHPDASISANTGVAGDNSITGIASGEEVEIIVTVAGCENDTLYFGPVNCEECQPFNLEIELEDATICIGESATLIANSDESNLSFSWYFEDQFIGDGEELTYTFNDFEESGVYYLVGSDDNDCFETDSVEIEVIRCGVVVPDGFSPNGDGVNDLFVIDGLLGFPNTKVTIFNRWGTQVFYDEDYQNDWDGRSQSGKNVGGDELPEGSYFYIIELGGNVNEDDSVLKGHLYIKR